MAAERQQLLDALSSPIRREILWLVHDRELAAGEIAAAFEVTAPTISQHLTVLRNAGLVDMRADGSFRRYRTRADALRGLEPLIAHERKWSASSAPDGDAPTAARVDLVTVVSVDVPLPPAEAFASFTDATRYSAWLGAPVSLVDGRFACTLETGRTVRGTYEVVVPPTLLVMRWDFDDERVPVPGDERVAYLRVTPTGNGSHVEVHQLVADEHQAAFMRVAWSSVFGRLHEFCTARLPRRRVRVDARRSRVRDDAAEEVR